MPGDVLYLRPVTGNSASQQDGYWRNRGFWVLCTTALVVRVLSLGKRDPWVDEANAILIGEAPIEQLLDKLALDSSPPLYFAILGVWGDLFGDTLIAYRLLSTLGGVGLVAITFVWGRRLLDQFTALWASAFLAVLPIAVFHSQQARPYSWIATLALLSTAALVGFIRGRENRWLALWIFATLMSLYLHATCLYLLPVHVAIIVSSGQIRAQLRSWLLAGLCIMLGFAPWLPTFLTQLTSNHYDYYLPHWSRMGPLGVLQETALAFSPAGERIFYFGEASGWFGIPAFLGVFLAGLGSVNLVRKARLATNWLTLWPLVMTVLPLALGVLGSLVLRPHYVPSRFDQLALPGFALLVGRGVASIKHRTVRHAAIAVVGTVAVITLGQRATKTHDAGNRALAASVREFYSEGDAIICTSVTRAPLQLLLREVPSDSFVSYPLHGKHHLGNFNPKELLQDPGTAAKHARATLTEALNRSTVDGEIIVVRALERANEMFTPMVFERFGVKPTATRQGFVQTGTGQRAVIEVYSARQLSRGG